MALKQNNQGVSQGSIRKGFTKTALQDHVAKMRETEAERRERMVEMLIHLRPVRSQDNFLNVCWEPSKVINGC